MCGGGKNPPDPVVPDPTPSPQPSNVSPQATEGQRARRIRSLRQGMLSTIKTSPYGISGTGSNLTGQNSGKTTLGS